MRGRLSRGRSSEGPRREGRAPDRDRNDRLPARVRNRLPLRPSENRRDDRRGETRSAFFPVVMNTAALLKLLDLLVSENPKGKGRGRNAHRFTVLLGLAFIAWNVRDVPELKRDVAEVRARVSSIEARLGVTRKALDTPAASRDELGSAAPGAVTPP